MHTLVTLPAAQCLHALQPTPRDPSQDITVKTYSRRNDSPKIESPVMSWAPYPSVLARVGCWVLVGDNGREGAGIRLEAVDFVTIVF